MADQGTLASVLSTFLRYLPNDSTFRSAPPATTATSLATRSTKYWSWLTSSTAPSKPSTQSASASMASRSKLLVGSSSTTRWGRSYETAAMATRERCPPLSERTTAICCSASTPAPAMQLRSSRSCASLPSPGKRASMNSSGVASRSSWSAWCWFTSAMRAPGARDTQPSVGSSVPTSTLTSVDFPAPFSPSRHSRVDESMDRSMPDSSRG
mmetsp:Transcript_11648/g.36030  ORF Transcript_11648/g.36030 Transcript_11648/m.36030 type:complete len:211 (-) Transcript_11648:227-859(-)